jgi:hypothetical protein
LKVLSYLVEPPQNRAALNSRVFFKTLALPGAGFEKIS